MGLRQDAQTWLRAVNSPFDRVEDQGNRYQRDTRTQEAQRRRAAAVAVV